MEHTRESASFGGRLRRYREAAGLTQEQLAERAGLTASGLAALERGRRLHPYPHTVQAIADALGLPAEQRAELAGATKRVSAGPTNEATRPTLPTPPTSLVGREQEVGEIESLLQKGESRLVTLTGPGGVGKTRLALEVAREMTGCFPDGAAFVSLAPVSDPALVVPTIAQSLGLSQAGRPPMETLLPHLRDRKTLLVLDNLEQVLEASPAVAELISVCPRLSVLATSRAPLRVRGEREYPLRPLGLPEHTRNLSPEIAASSDAVRLLVSRVRETMPTFELTRANTAAVAVICRRLDGIPLALELAAARMRAMSPTELLARLDRSLPLLTGGARDLPERQRTMRSTIEWSYQLLDEPSWRLLNRLSVFRGGWDLEAAEAVGAGHRLEEEVLDLLSSLVEQSLVITETVHDGHTRYRLLVPVQEYAHQRLEESGEAEETRRRHAEYFLVLADEAEQELRGSRSVEMLGRLDADRDNLRVAMDYLLGRGDGEAAARMAWGLWLFWWIRGHFREGWRWTQAALESNPDTPPLARARLLAVAGAMAIGQDDQRGAEMTYSGSYPLFESVGNADGLGRANIGLGIIALARGDRQRADQYLREAVDIYRRLGDNWYAGLTLSYLGLASLSRGEYGAAEMQLDEGIALMRTAGDRVGVCIVLYNRSLLAQAQRDYDRVAALFGEVLLLSSEIGDLANTAYCMEGLAAVAVSRGDEERAATLLGAANGLIEVLGAPVYTYRPDRSLHEQTVTSARCRLGERAWGAAWAKGREMTLGQVVSYTLQGLKAEREGTPDPLAGD